MRILITGGAGFIGMNLSRKLIQLGYDVYIVDCLHPYYSNERKKVHLQQIRNFGNVHFYRHDLLDPVGTKKLFLDISPHVVIHLAALPGVSYSLEQPLAYIDYDIKATVNVLEAAGTSEVKKVIFASSSSVYGDQPQIPLKEEMANGRLISPYAAAKWSAESFCHVYASFYSFQLTILRFFTVYGPWGRPDMAIAKFIKQIMKGEPISVYGKGSARDYTYVDDIVEGIILAMNHFASETKIYNIGAGHPISMNSLLDHLTGQFGRFRLENKPTRKGDVHSTWADISKAKSELDFSPKVSFEEGLKRTISWAYEYEKYL
ncbi:UDP-glucuronate 4-epimerase [Oikeobacillus pervagus]|uniref:UDP-glucuronate 4-epimerase n=1 Tax=Oikeobacillus pervagus TaxID=1325931 RepID=A0AAJ1SZ19_9BACI|nr:NAD-dependent epimerase/dehydratase family protein [Oikeobacillus pervagus]MDQ0215440.1 UDP-glucuronate 4-epimerase [Oikeobacillus pervagus]